MAGVMVVDTNYGYLSAVFRGGGKLILSPLNMTWSPKLANLDIWSHWFSFFFSTFLGAGGGERGNGRKSGSGGIQMWLLLFYCYTGGKMVEKWIWKKWKLPYMSLSPKLLTLHIWLIFFYISTFQPGVKLVDKMDLEASRCDLKPEIGQIWHLDSLFFKFSTFTFSP